MLLIRPAVRDDVPLLKMLIHEFAEFEHDQALVTEDNLLRDGFGSQPKVRVLIAEWNSQPAGNALFFEYCASFQGRGIFLEDLVHAPAFSTQEYRQGAVGTHCGNRSERRLLRCNVHSNGMEHECNRVLSGLVCHVHERLESSLP
jgi:hypothetical protein